MIVPLPKPTHQGMSRDPGMGTTPSPHSSCFCIRLPPPCATSGTRCGAGPIRYLPNTSVPCTRSDRGTGRSEHYSRSCWGHTGRPGCSPGRTWSADSLVRGQRGTLLQVSLLLRLSRNAQTFPAVPQAEPAVEAESASSGRELFAFPLPQQPALELW